MKDDLDRLIDELAAERPDLRERLEAAIARRVTAAYARAHHAQDAARGQGLSVRDAAALLGITPAGLKLHDARLRPTRDSSGRRTYDRAAVLALGRERRAGARSKRGRAS